MNLLLVHAAVTRSQVSLPCSVALQNPRRMQLISRPVTSAIHSGVAQSVQSAPCNKRPAADVRRFSRRITRVAVAPISAVEAGLSPLVELQLEEQVSLIDDRVCRPAVVKVDQEAHPKYTELTIKAADYPGLMRVITWVLNGLEFRVQNAILTTDKDGFANNTFWLQSYSGTKAPTELASLLAERIAEFIKYCTPPPHSHTADEFMTRQVKVDNKSDPDFTCVTILGEPPGHGFLLEVASAISGIGLVIHEGIIQGDPDMSLQVWSRNSSFDATASGQHDLSKGRLFKFWLCSSNQQKLDYTQCTALLYVLDTIMIGRTNPTQPPSPGFGPM